MQETVVGEHWLDSTYYYNEIVNHDQALANASLGILPSGGKFLI